MDAAVKNCKWWSLKGWNVVFKTTSTVCGALLLAHRPPNSKQTNEVNERSQRSQRTKSTNERSQRSQRTKSTNEVNERSQRTNECKRSFSLSQSASLTVSKAGSPTQTKSNLNHTFPYADTSSLPPKAGGSTPEEGLYVLWSFGVLEFWLIFDLEYKRWCVEPSLNCVFYFTDMGRRDLWVTVLYVVLVCWFVCLFVCWRAVVFLSLLRCFVRFCRSFVRGWLRR